MKAIFLIFYHQNGISPNNITKKCSMLYGKKEEEYESKKCNYEKKNKYTCPLNVGSQNQQSYTSLVSSSCVFHVCEIGKENLFPPFTCSHFPFVLPAHLSNPPPGTTLTLVNPRSSPSFVSKLRSCTNLMVNLKSSMFMPYGYLNL